MTMELYRADLTLKEHTYFASREVGTLYESEPFIGNYALTYALHLCDAPYRVERQVRYKQDLAPLNARGIYVTPATFYPGELRFAFSQFNAQTDSYYFRFDQNAIATHPGRKARAANFPQAGKIRMLALESRAFFYLFAPSHETLQLPSYIRLGKFNSKAHLTWEHLDAIEPNPVEMEQRLDFFLNAADLPSEATQKLSIYALYNIYPAPLIRQCRMQARFWQAKRANGDNVLLPAGMRYGVEAL